MRLSNENREFLKEHFARFVATIVLLSMGWGAFLVWQWLATLMR